MQFSEFTLDSRVAAGVTDAGFTTATPIQEQAIPVVLDGRDIIGVAQTGTGKTAAFILPILNRLCTSGGGGPRALVLAPTRELAEQIYQAAVTFGAHTGVTATTVYGGVSKFRQVNALRRRPGILVACPGRLLDHLADRTADLSRLEVLVLDEADRMCDMGFLPDVKRVLSHVPRNIQRLFFSATMPQEVRSLADTMLTDPHTIQIGNSTPVALVTNALYPTTDLLKTNLLYALLDRDDSGRTLVFTRTKHRARRLAVELEKRKHRVAALQGNMTQSKRQAAIDGFRAGQFDVLVATDIASRGIDVTDVMRVINFDMPDTVDAFTHRIGRTGRAERTGESLTFMTEADIPMVRAIEHAIGGQLEQRRVDGFDYSTVPPMTTDRPMQWARTPQRAGGRGHNGSGHNGSGRNGSGRSGPPSGRGRRTTSPRPSHA